MYTSHVLLAALMSIAVSDAGRLPSATVVAEMNLSACPEGSVLDSVKPSPEVDRFFTQAMPWGDLWTNALTAPRRWKMASSMRTVREKASLLQPILGRQQAAKQSVVLEHPAKDDRCLLTGDLLWKDYTVEAAIRVTGTSTRVNADNDVHVVPMAGIMFRSQTVRRHYFFTIEPRSGFRLYCRDDGSWSVLASSATPIDAGRYYKLRVSVSGSKLRCLEGDRELFAVQDDRLAFGRVGVRFNTEAKVAYVTISMTQSEREAAQQARIARDREERELEQRLPRPVLWRTLDLAPFGKSVLGFAPTQGGNEKQIVLAGRVKKGPAVLAITLEGRKLWECRGAMRIAQIGGPLRDGTYRLTGILARPDRKGEVLAAIKLRDGQVVAESPLPTIPGRKLEFMFTTNSLVDLRGVGAPSDFILREGNDGNTLWAYDDHLRLLWTAKVAPNFGHGNSLGFLDVNGDGKEEVLAGGTLLGSDGKQIWQMKDLRTVLKKAGGVHIDAVVFGDLAGDPARDPVISLQAGSDGVYFLDPRTGKTRTHTQVGHAQGRYVGKFRPDVPGVQVQVGTRWDNYGILSIFDAKGQRLATFQPDTVSQGGPPVNWTGDGQEHIFIYTSKQGLGFYDGWGRRALRFSAGEIPERFEYLASSVFVENLMGDPRDELAFVVDGKLSVYTQDRPPANPQRVYSPVRRSVMSLPGWARVSGN